MVGSGDVRLGHGGGLRRIDGEEGNRGRERGCTVVRGRRSIVALLWVEVWLGRPSPDEMDLARRCDTAMTTCVPPGKTWISTSDPGLATCKSRLTFKARQHLVLEVGLFESVQSELVFSIE